MRLLVEFKDQWSVFLYNFKQNIIICQNLE
jgi:hypothetical protein